MVPEVLEHLTGANLSWHVAETLHAPLIYCFFRRACPLLRVLPSFWGCVTMCHKTYGMWSLREGPFTNRNHCPSQHTKLYAYKIDHGGFSFGMLIFF